MSALPIPPGTSYGGIRIDPITRLPDFTSQLQGMRMPQANFAQPRPNFIQGLGGALFPASPGMDPQAAQAAQGRALLQMGLGMMGAGSRPGATLGGSLFEGYGRASQNYTGAMDQAFRNTLVQKESERQERADERQKKADERAERQSAATTAGRISTGIGSSTDPMSYWNLVKQMPEVQDTLGAYGIDPATITTPEQLQQVAQQFGAAGQIGGPVLQNEGPMPMQEWRLYNSLSPQDQPRYLEMKRAQQSFVPEIGGVRTLVQPGVAGQPATQQPLSTLQTEEEARRRLETAAQTGRELMQADESGRLTPIAGSKEDLERKGAARTAKSALDRQNDQLGTMGRLADNLARRASSWTTGLIGSAAAGIAGTPQHDLSRDIDTLKSVIGFRELQAIRDSSPTGGALGPVSDFENKLLQATLANLEQSQSPEQFRRNLRIVQEQAETSWKRIQAAYDEDYGQKTKAADGWSIVEE